MAHKYRRKATLVFCNHAGCRTLTEGKYCSKHEYKPPPRTRDKFLDSAAWKRLRDAKFAETPWCEKCLAETGVHVPALDVDHIKPRRTHPHLALVYANLQSLCGACHMAKTRVGL